MKFTPTLPPAKPSPPTIPNRTGGTQHTTHCVPEEVFKLRLLAQNVNDDADDLLMLNKKIGQALIRFFSEMQSVQRMANAEFADEEYATATENALKYSIEKLDSNTYWRLLRLLTLMGKIGAVRAGVDTRETPSPDDGCTQI